MKLMVGKKRQPRATGRQRNDTLREAPAAYSYHAQRASRPESPGRQQSSLAEKRSRVLSLRYWIKRSGAVIVTLVGIICAISLLSLSTEPRIILLDEGNSYAFREAAAYQEVINQQLASSFWNRNKITINTGANADALKKQFPEISTVNISLPLVGHRPIYYLQANAPAFVIQAVNGSFVLDSKGKALITKDGVNAAPTDDLPVVTDQTGARVNPGKQIISRSNIAFMQTVLATLAAKDVTVESLVLPAQKVQQLNVRVSGKSYIIKFDMHESGGARQQVGSYLATASQLERSGTVPSQYIDVRVLGRAYYK